jgi:hypothetical protein
VIVSDIYSRVKRQFGDESGVQLTDDDILRYINSGQREIVMQNEGLLEKTALTSTVANQQEYDLPVDLLILKFISLKYTDQLSYFKLRGLKTTDFNEYIDGWSGTALGTAAPYVYTIFSGKIILFPIPDTSVVDALKIYYNRKPVDVAGSSDTPDLPELYHEALVKYCLQQAYEMDEDWDASQLKGSALDSDIALLRGREEWREQETYPVITVRQEDEYI